MSQPLWKPSATAIAQSNMMRFVHHLKQHLPDYAALYQWSITFPEEFWPALWEFCEIKSAKKWDHVLIHPEKMPGAKWFSGAKLNFAENLLRRRDNKSALIFSNERNQRRELSYFDLYQKVAQLAAALREAGVRANDRVAAFMPNMPETIIAMLATTSIGAIWSSCSPDFGINGVYDRFGQIQPKILFTADGYFYNGTTYDSLERVKGLQEKISSIEKTIVVPYVHSNPDIQALKHSILFDDFLITEAQILNFEPQPFDHPVYIMYSSGTTGEPKCIVHGAGGILLQHLKELVLHTDLKPDDVIFYYTTCGWMMWNWFVSSLAVGATLILYDGAPLHPKASVLFDLIDAEKITVFGTSAKFITAVEKAELVPMETHSLNSLRTILSTGSPLLPMNFDYVYQKIKKEVCLSSISGGTDIVSCFALGNPILPVYRGELQCRGLGLKVEVYDENGKSVRNEKGELVCTAPFPAMPVYFWNDPTHEKYRKAYFEKFPNVWSQGDYAEITKHDGVIIYGRSDALLKPRGVRIGTAEIYRQVEKIEEVMESIVVGQEWKDDIRLVLFVRLRDGEELTEDLKNKIKKTIRDNASPHHVPEKIIQVKDIPRTISGKIVELAVRDVIHDRVVKNKDALANPEALEYFKNLEELKH